MTNQISSLKYVSVSVISCRGRTCPSMGGARREMMYFLPLLNPGVLRFLPLSEEIPEEAEVVEAVDLEIL